MENVEVRKTVVVRAADDGKPAYELTTDDDGLVKITPLRVRRRRVFHAHLLDAVQQLAPNTRKET
jgi:hypothetical protein